MSNPEQILDRARRIAALAQRGVDGERLNAERMLAEFLAKHGLEVEDLEREERQWYEFDKVDVPNGDMLWAQCVGSVADTQKQVRCSGGNVIGYQALLTAAEHAEACMKLAVFVPLYKDELQVWFLSFLHANELFGLGPSRGDLSEKEKEQNRRAATMSMFVDRRMVRKGLGNGNGERTQD
jgi:hypothetical protein